MDPIPGIGAHGSGRWYPVTMHEFTDRNLRVHTATMSTPFRPAAASHPPRMPLFLSLLLVLALGWTGRSVRAAGFDFDWSMPDRFGVDADLDGLVDYLQVPAEISPSSWTVIFAINHTLTDVSAVEIRVDGRLVGQVANPAAQTRFPLAFPAERDYQVELVAVQRSGQRVSVTHEVRVQDWLIVGLGDSIGSGEGNPDIPLTDELVQAYEQATTRIQSLGQSLVVAVDAVAKARADRDEIKARYKTFWDSFDAYQAAVAHENATCTSVVDLSPACVSARSQTLAATQTFLAQAALLSLGSALAEAQAKAKAIEEAAVEVLRKAQETEDGLRAELDAARQQRADLAAKFGTKDGGPFWQEAADHRSAWAGQARAALKLERDDPRTSVTFIHLSKSGDKIPDVPTQLAKLRDRLSRVGREVDAVLVSAGANDAGFSDILRSLMKFQGSHRILPTGTPPTPTSAFVLQDVLNALCQKYNPARASAGECDSDMGDFNRITETGATIFGKRLPLLAPNYAELSVQLGNVSVLPWRVYLTEYPDAARRSDGNACREDFLLVPGVENEEWDWVAGTVIPQLNAAVRQGAASQGWNFVSGIQSAFRTHGLCADVPWMVNFQRSYMVQGDIEGVSHPNRAGHQAIGDLIFQALKRDLYPASEGQAREPEMPLVDVTSPGDPIVLVNGVNDGDSDAGDPPPQEGVANAIDDSGRKYLNFKDLASGLVVSPSVGRTIVKGLRVYTANDAEERDPASFQLSGSVSGPAGPFKVIAEGPFLLPAERHPGGEGAISVDDEHYAVRFENDVAYTSYRLIFPTLKNPLSANSMQVAEVEFLGYLAPSQPSNNADLAGLALSTGTLAPVFTAGSTGYSVRVPNGTLSMTVTPTAADGGAAIWVNGVRVASGAASGPLNLAVGSNTVTVRVIAQDGTTVKTYVLTVTRADGGPSAVSLVSGLRAYWTFDGDLKDSMGVFHGTGHGSRPLAFGEGQAGFGKALQLDGIDQFVEITGGEPDALAFAGGSVSIAGWFKVGSFDTDWQALVAKGEGNNWRVARRSAERGLAYAGGLPDTSTGKDINDAGWHHFTAVSDAAGTAFGTALYIDGALDTVVPGQAALTANGVRMLIGENPEARGREWNGLVDDLGIWNRVLTPKEISALYASGRGQPLGAFLAPSDITFPGDPIVAIDGTDDGDGAVGGSPAGEGVEQAIDNTVLKYLNFQDLNSGFAVTPSVGATVVTGLRIYTANDAEARDPASFELSGSLSGLGGPWTLIARGDLSLPSSRTGVLPLRPITLNDPQQEHWFVNDRPYTTYRLVFPTLKDHGAANSMQVAEVELLGTVGSAPVAGSIAIERGGGGITIRYTGILESANQVAGPYSAVVGASSPFAPPLGAGARYFRARK